MKKTLLLKTICLFFLIFSSSISFSQTHQSESTSYTQDSLKNLLNTIDNLDIFQLKKLQEAFIYKNRKEPNSQNKMILQHIEHRMKEIEHIDNQKSH